MALKKEIKADSLVPRAEQLTEAISYQPGSVVSKQIIKKETGNITLFAFDEGEGLTEHTSPYNAFVYILDGEAEIFISKNPFNLKSGDMIVMPANEPHALKALKKFKMLLVMIR